MSTKHHPSGRRQRLRSTETGRRRRVSASSSSSGRIAAASTRARAVEDRFETLERRLTAVIDALDALESRVGGLRRSADERITALEKRLQAMERRTGKGAERTLDPDRLAQRVAAQAIAPVLKAIDQRLAGLPKPGAESGDYNHKHFVSLAREVRQLRKQLEARSEASEELVALVNTPGFKELLDRKLKTVIGYLAEDVIPKIADGAVLRALAAQDR